MNNYTLRDELTQKIDTFNQIFELDFVNADENDKDWKSYLDPITKHLFNTSYLSFIKDNPLEVNVPPGSLEKYYNLFCKIIEDFKTMTRLKIPNEIYCAADDIKQTFNDFIRLNRISVSMVKKEVNESLINYYQLYPTF